MSRLKSRSLGGIRAKVVLGATALALAVAPAGVAHAEKYLSKSLAERAATEWVADHYEDTYESDLGVVCRPYGRRAAAPGYVYRAWTCKWYDSSDGTQGRIRVMGANGRGMYIAYVLNAPH